MDIQNTIHRRTKKNWHPWVLAGAALILLSGWQLIGSTPQPSLEGDDLWVAKVKQGDLPVLIDGYGKLTAKHQRFLTSPAQATVEEIFFHPGARVEADTVLMRLANPQIEQQVAQARLELARQRAALRERDISQQSQYLAREAEMAQLTASLENSKLRAEAESQLATKGIVSSLDFKRTQLEVQQLQQRVGIEQQRLLKLTEMHEQGLAAQRELVKQMQLNVEVQQKIFDRLTVRAGISGILQALPVELGQSIGMGGQLALVGSTDSLIAELKVSQRNAAQIKLGDIAHIDTFGGKADGVVQRIDPVVEEGRILVEVEISGPLPTNARPELNIEGKLLVATLKQALYIEHPANTDPHSSHPLFKVSDDRRTARAQTLSFGTLAGRYIQINDGAQVGDEFVISDTSAQQKAEHIELSLGQ